MADLEARILSLEHIEAIKNLKARYLNACDDKAIDRIRACFAPGSVKIDYGVVGCWDDREGLIAAFDAQGNHPHIVDTHHGSNPEINLVGDDRAVARWALFFHQINTKNQTTMQLSGRYDDEYRLIEGEWLIVATKFTVISSLVAAIDDGLEKIQFAGNPALV